MAEQINERKCYVEGKLEPLMRILPNIAAGDFSKRLDIPEEDDEFTMLLMGINYLQTELSMRFNKGVTMSPSSSNATGVDNSKKDTCSNRPCNKYYDLYKVMIETSDDMIFTVDLHGNFTYVNKALEKYLGYSNEEIRDINGFELIHPDDIESVAKQFARLPLGESVNDLEYRYRTKNGDYIDILNNAGPIYNEDGKVVAAFGIARNITQRKAMEKELITARDDLEIRVMERTAELEKINSVLKNSEEKYRLLLDNANDGIIVAQDGMLKYFNPKVKEITGYSDKELVSKSFIEFIHPDDRAMTRIQHMKRLEGSSSPLPYSIRAITKPGEIRLFEINGVKISWEGRPATLNFLKDITDRKMIEEALCISEDRYRKISELISDFVYSIRIEPDGTQISEWSTDTINRVIGISHDELLKGGWKDVIHPEDLPFLAERQQILASGESDVREYRIVKNDGEVRWVRDYGNPVWDEAQGRVVRIYGAAQDISDRKRAEEKLKQSEEKYTALFERSNDAVYTCDFDGNFIDANPTALKMLGYTKDEISSIDFSSLLSKEQLSLAFDTLKEVIETGTQKEIIEYRLKRKDGNFLWVESKGSLVYKNGEPIAVQGIARDITERKRAEEALQESEEKFRLLFENASEGILFIDLDGNIIGANPKVFEIAGFREEELLGKNILDVTALFKLNPEHMMPLFQEMLSETPSTNTEWEITNKNGERVVVLAHPSLVKKKGDIIGLSVIIEDITERKRAGEALRESEGKFRNLAEKSPNMIFINAKGQVVYVNEKSENVMGYTKDELYSRDFDFLSLIAEESRELVKANLGRHMKGEEVPPYEYTLLTKNGKRIEGILTTKLIRYEGGDAILGIVTDITERKRAEKALRESEELYSALVENSEDGIVIIQDGVLKFVNRSSLNLLGYSSDETKIGENFLNFIAPHYREMVIRNYTERMEGKKVPNIYEVLLLRNDGTTVPVEINATIIDYKGKPADLVFIRNLTERKRAEESLIHSEKLAGIGILSSGIAHEINNPLAGIMGYAEVIMEETNPENIRQYAKQIVKNVERASDIVNWLSRYSRGAKDSNVMDVDLNEILNESLEALKLTRDTTGINISRDYNHIPTIKGNRTELQQIFLNLLNNAIDALPDSGDIGLSTIADNGFIKVMISDNGRGIPNDHIGKVFEPFFTTKKVGEGTGLGLYVTSMIVKKHYGQIDVESEIGKGTSFTLKFPKGKALPQISDITFDYKSG